MQLLHCFILQYIVEFWSLLVYMYLYEPSDHIVGELDSEKIRCKNVNLLRGFRKVLSTVPINEYN